MVWLFLLAFCWVFLVAYQTRSIVQSQYVKAIISEFLLCICWFVSLKMIVADKFSITAFAVYTSGSVLGMFVGIWTHKRGKR